MTLKKILLLEDHHLLAEIMAYTLGQIYSGSGVEVCRVHNVADFDSELKSESYDLIVSDLNLPDAGPLEMSLFLEGLPAQMRTRIVLWSSEPWSRLKALNLLAYKRLPKNVGVVEIKECLDVFFRRNS